VKAHTTIKLTTVEAAEIIKAYMEKEKGIAVESVDFEMGTVTTGYGMVERDDHVLKSVNIRTTTEI